MREKIKELLFININDYYSLITPTKRDKFIIIFQIINTARKTHTIHFRIGKTCHALPHRSKITFASVDLCLPSETYNNSLPRHRVYSFKFVSSEYRDEMLE
jgi:hypothetical protein